MVLPIREAPAALLCVMVRIAQGSRSGGMGKVDDGAFGPGGSFPNALQVVGDWLPMAHPYDQLTFLWLGGIWGVERTSARPTGSPSPTPEQ